MSSNDTRSIPLPLAGGKTWVTIQGRFPLTPTEFDQLTALLEAMKPGLVAEPESEPNDRVKRKGERSNEEDTDSLCPRLAKSP